MRNIEVKVQVRSHILSVNRVDFELDESLYHAEASNNGVVELKYRNPQETFYLEEMDKVSEFLVENNYSDDVIQVNGHGEDGEHIVALAGELHGSIFGL